MVSLNIAIINNDPDDQTLFLEALESVSDLHNISVFDSGIKFLETHRTDASQLSLKTPDLILMDSRLPILSASDTLRKIRCHSDLESAMAVVFFTYLDRKYDDQLRQEGACYCLQKPNTFGQLKKIIASCVQSYTEKPLSYTA